MSQSVKSTCPYCGVGCGVILTEVDEQWTVKGDPEHPANYGRLCSKGSALADTVGLSDRMQYPSIQGKKVSWDTAISTISTQFSDIIKTHGPDAVAFYVSGQLLTEDYYVANKLMKGFIGSGNIDTNSRLCMSSAVAGYKRAFGADSVPCSYEDIDQADLIILEGSNLAWCHPILFQRINQAKQQRPNLQVIVIDPRQTASCDIADLHLPLKLGTDAVLFNGLLHYLATQGYDNTAFIEQSTEGVEAALAIAEKTARTSQIVAAQCGLTEQQVDAFYKAFATTEKAVTLYSQGINQSSSGTDKSNSIINCYLLTGRVGQSGMGPFSVTGQPNAMGGREVGGLSNQLAAHMEIDNPRHRDTVAEFWQTKQLASNAGAKAVDMFRDVASGKIKAIWIMATNPVVSMPDADAVKAALEKCELVIVSDCEATTDTTECADILLPALAWGEKSGTVTNSERRISRQRAFLPSPFEAKADWWIISQVARKMGFEKAFNYHNSADVFREHAALSGFQNQGERDFNISGLSHITNEHYDDLTPTQWPITPTQLAGTARLFTDGKFFTDNKKARFIAITPRLPIGEVTGTLPLMLNTGRVRDHWHTMTRTARSATLNGHTAEPSIDIHPQDIMKFGLKDGMLAKVTSALNTIVVRVVQTSKQACGTAFIPMHWNAQFAANARVDSLVAAHVDPISGQPELKQTPIAVSRYQSAWQGFILSRDDIPLTTIKAAGLVQYWVKIKGKHFWRYELSGEKQSDVQTVLDELLTINKTEWIEYADSSQEVYRYAHIVDDQLQAVAMFSNQTDLPARAWLSQLFQETELDPQVRHTLLAGKAGKGVPDAGAIVCACFGVGENTIKEAITCGKAMTTEQLGQQLKAGTNCGSCLPELNNLISNTKPIPA